MKIEVRVGDFVKCFNRDNYNEVITIDEFGCLILDNKRRVPSDDDIVEDFKDSNEYSKFENNFDL